MRIQDLKERSNEPKPDYPNPLRSIGMNDPLFQKWADLMDEVEGELLDRYKKENNIIQSLVGKEYGDAIKKLRYRYGQVITVPISNLTSIEPFLYKDHLDTLLRGGERKPDLPLVYKMGSNYLIGDGNHRVVADYLGGKKSTKVVLMDLDKLWKALFRT